MERRAQNENSNVIMNYKFFTLPDFRDVRGVLQVLELKNLPFRPKRLYFINSVKGKRGGHAHSTEKEIFINIRGTFRGRIHDSKRWHSFSMRKPGQCLYTANLIWHEFDHFSSDAIMLALSSIPYEGEKGYIMDFEKFLHLCRKKLS